MYIDSLEGNIKIININAYKSSFDFKPENAYEIGIGDQISITVWGLPEFFPMTGINPESNLRRVDGKGNIFFPFVGNIRAAGKTQDQLRHDLTIGLSGSFNDPQLDVSISKFNSQRVYLLGEVTKPMRIDITDIPLTLSDALGQASGVNTVTANGEEVFIIRQAKDDEEPLIFRADLSSPSGFLDAGNFYLKNEDIIYVNAKGTTRWNRVISQFFPFSTFLNSIDNLVNSE